ncbi:hypothetical protein ACIGD1_11300 [Streptomyces sp. NPDC085612]|uniref:hypothetical protein n=1 Tax=Streptomyces sp. NPDC085612 TaxID=3365732 RepID=UPI0037D2AE7F
MTHRTQLSQEDEGLRRATRDDRIRAGLAYAISRLRDPRAHHEMTSAARMAIAQRYGTDTLGWTDEAEELIRDLLGAMPEITREITRGEYALILDRA